MLCNYLGCVAVISQLIGQQCVKYSVFKKKDTEQGEIAWLVMFAAQV